MIRVALGGLLAAAVMTSAVSAADLIVEDDIAAEAIAVADDWTGGYVGVFAGFGLENTSQTNTVTLATTDNFTGDGWLAGVAAGANWQSGMLVFGAEVDAAWSNIAASTTNNCPASCNNEVNWLATARARLGLAPSEAILLYGTVGVAVAGVSSSSVTEGSSTPVGLAYGVGAEVMVADQVSVKAEYLRVDLPENHAYDVPAEVVNDYIDLDLFKLGVNWHF